jgi:hypothetical protein
MVTTGFAVGFADTTILAAPFCCSDYARNEASCPTLPFSFGTGLESLSRDDILADADPTLILALSLIFA